MGKKKKEKEKVGKRDKRVKKAVLIVFYGI